jgi:tetratricopeptide (TPR) repeat protein
MSQHRRNGDGKPLPGGEPDRPRGRPPAIGLSQIPGTSDYELVHPRCVLQRRADYEDGMELLKAGDPEGARDAFRFALEGCGDNLWIHVALGKIALEMDQDYNLARGHFGYAFELVERALPKSIAVRLPKRIPGNSPFFDAAEGLASCYEGMNRRDEANRVRRLADRLAGSGS